MWDFIRPFLNIYMLVEQESLFYGHYRSHFIECRSKTDMWFAIFRLLSYFCCYCLFWYFRIGILFLVLTFKVSVRTMTKYSFLSWYLVPLNSQVWERIFRLKQILPCLRVVGVFHSYCLTGEFWFGLNLCFYFWGSGTYSGCRGKQF